MKRLEKFAKVDDYIITTAWARKNSLFALDLKMSRFKNLEVACQLINLCHHFMFAPVSLY